MYNGIGVRTPRGTGTNGFVQRNFAQVKIQRRVEAPITLEPRKQTGGNQAILEHERKRQIEIECLKLYDELKEKCLEENHIEERVALFRQKLQSQTVSFEKNPKQLQEHQTHELAEAKQRELKKIETALGIQSDKHVEGRAFDRELQEKERAERQRIRAEASEQQNKRRKQDHLQREPAQKSPPRQTSNLSSSKLNNLRNEKQRILL